MTLNFTGKITVVLGLATCTLLSSKTASAQQQSQSFPSPATVSHGVLLDRKESLSPDLWGRYWRDVHGPIAARIVGLHEYWQHHLSAPLIDFWSNLGTTIDQSVQPQYVIEGLAEVTFVSEAVRSKLGSSRAAAQLGDDEQNLFAGTWLYLAREGNARTIKDQLTDNAPQGSQTVLKLIVLLRQKTGIGKDEFRSFVINRFANVLAADNSVRKVRMHLVETYDPSVFKAPNVEHNLPVEQQIQAWAEVVFEDRRAADSLFASLPYKAVSADAKRYLEGVSTYPVHSTYTLVYGGRPTLVGLRGLDVATAVRAVGARNQTSEEVLRTLYGSDIKEPLK